MIILVLHMILLYIIVFLVLVGLITIFDEIKHKKRIIHYFSSGQIKKYNCIGYAYIDYENILHITNYKERCIGKYVITTLPYRGGFPIDKHGNAIIITMIGNRICEKHGGIIPKVLKNLYIKCKE